MERPNNLWVKRPWNCIFRVKKFVFFSASGGLRPHDPPLWSPYTLTSGFFFLSLCPSLLTCLQYTPVALDLHLKVTFSVNSILVWIFVVVVVANTYCEQARLDIKQIVFNPNFHEWRCSHYIFTNFPPFFLPKQMTAYYRTFEEFFKENLPKLCSHFSHQNVTPNLYIMEW